MAPKSTHWTTDKEYRLIHEVRERNILWDVSLVEYRRNDLKEVHWDEIAKILGPSYTSEIVKKRFINMKDTFMENNRRVRESAIRCSGKSPDEIYVPRWPLFNSLKFLQKTVAQRQSSSNVEVPVSSQAYDASIFNRNQVYYDDNSEAFAMIPEDNMNGSNFTENAVSAEQNGRSNQRLEDSTSCILTTCQSPRSSSQQSYSSFSSPSHTSSYSSPTPDLSRNQPKTSCSVGNETMFDKRGTKRSRKTAADEALQLMKEVAARPPRTYHPPDKCESLAMYIAAKLREMTAEEQCACEAKIMHIIFTKGKD